MKIPSLLILSLVLLVGACDSTMVSEQPEISTGTQWDLISIVTEQDTLRADTLWRAPDIRFGGVAEDGSYPLGGYACLHYEGRYKLEDGNHLTIFDLKAKVTDGCGEVHRRVYAALFRGLRAAESYEMRSLSSSGKHEEDLVLFIYFDGGRGVMRFETSKIIP